MSADSSSKLGMASHHCTCVYVEISVQHCAKYQNINISPWTKVSDCLWRHLTRRKVKDGLGPSKRKGNHLFLPSPSTRQSSLFAVYRALNVTEGSHFFSRQSSLFALAVYKSHERTLDLVIASSPSQCLQAFSSHSLLVLMMAFATSIALKVADSTLKSMLPLIQ